MSSFSSKDTDRASASGTGDFSYLDYLVAHHSSGQWSPLPEGVDLPRIKRLGEAFAAAWAQEPELELTQQQRQMGGDGLLYGEVQFDSFGVILETVRLQLNALPAAGSGRFCDIGSGTGKALLAAATLHDWKKCVGVEVVPQLAEFAQNAKQRWLSCENLQQAIDQERVGASSMASVEIVLGNALEFDYSEMDFVFVNSTALGEQFMKHLVLSLRSMRPGTVLVTTTFRLPDASWRVVSTAYMPFSWGSTDVLYHIHESDYPRFVQLHKAQLEKLTGLKPTADEVVPLWKRIGELVVGKEYNAGELVQFVCDDEDESNPDEPLSPSQPQDSMELMAIVPLKAKDPSSIFLLDHAWTFLTLTDAEKCLRSMPTLLARVASIVGVPFPSAEAASSSIDSCITSILERLPAKLHTYTIMQPVEVGGTSTQAPITFYYLCDEVGSCLTSFQADSSSLSNMRMSTFFSMDDKTAYSLAWPVEDIDEGDCLKLTRTNREVQRISDSLVATKVNAIGRQLIPQVATMNAEFVDVAVKAELEARRK